MLIDPTSLARTIDAASLRVASGDPIGSAERDGLVEWFLDRQVRTGRSDGLFVPHREEVAAGVRLFTGEPLRTRLAVGNVLTLEAGRILVLVGGDRPDVRDALCRASAAMRRACFAASHCVIGECAHSSIAYMRSAAIDRSGDRRKWIEDHLAVLRAHQDGTGRWTRFPFYYTLLALVETGTPSANAELAYAMPACERVLARKPTDPFSERRQLVLSRALAVAQS